MDKKYLNIEHTYKDYKYALLKGSRWLRLYKTNANFLTVISVESDKYKGIDMDLFNEIGDYWSNTGYDFYDNNELFYAMKNDLKREDVEKIQQKSSIT